MVGLIDINNSFNFSWPFSFEVFVLDFMASWNQMEKTFCWILHNQISNPYFQGVT